jgi:leucyl/phenylalanyl-tRNA--protein transferase
MISIFPDVSMATEDGLLAVGGNLDIQSLTDAYTKGIFPWPVEEGYPLTWFAPDPRGLIKMENVKFSKSLLRFIKKMDFEVKFNTDFRSVITECAMTKRKHESGTWIYDNIIEGYTNLFNAKKAYCVSVYQNERLIGGLYGVCFGEIISGESMFYREDNASKVALYYLINKIKEAKIPFIDTQMVTPIVETFGGELVDRKTYTELLNSLNTEITRDSIFN